MTSIARRSMLVAAVLLAAACGEKKEAPSAPAAAPTTAAPAPAPTAAPTPAAPPAATATQTPPPTPPTRAPTATPTATPTPTAPAATPAPASSAHAKVGPEKCKMCHRLQYDSWAASPHHAKGLDCEGCHGNGADYWSAAVMRDPAKAKAAGLVIPDLSACRKCHGAKADAALYAKVHAHKPS